jgi:hypothetical protein
MRIRNESQVIFEYSQSHETLARSIPIYLEVVERFPQTKAAKDAIFSAAVAHERLSDLNDYWRQIYGGGLFAGTRMVEFGEIGRLYPNFRWPTSRHGWEASTRTVNGGPAYPPVPTPAPKLTREQRIVRKIDRVADKVSTKVNSALNASASLLQDQRYLIFFALGMFGVWKYRRGRQM